MKLVLQTLIAVIACNAAVSTAANGSTIHVIGQNDMAIDRGAIQAAIDSAAQGDTVLLEGMFQLDGTPIFVRTSRLTIAGKAVDGDGDGLINEDRSDGIDNDGDGATDEDGWDAVLQGVDDGAGGPSSDAFPNRFNDGFEILGIDDRLHHIEFRDLEFRKINRGIYLFPDYDDAGTVLLCGSASPRAGRLDHITVKRNAFVDGVRGVEILGRVKAVSIRHNTFSNMTLQSVLLFGQTIGCAEPDGSIVQFIPLGTPRFTDIVDNIMSAVRQGVLSFISDRTSVRRNDMQAFSVAVGSIEDKDLLVSGNEINDSFFGVLGTSDPRYEGPSSGNLVGHNRITGSLIAVLVDCVSTGYTAVNNEFSGSVVADVIFDGTAPGGFCTGVGDSFGNKVVATQFPTTVQDFGSNNELIGKQIIDITTP